MGAPPRFPLPSSPSSPSMSYLSYLTVDKGTRGAMGAAVKDASFSPSVTVARDSDFIAEMFENGIPSAYAHDKLGVEEKKVIALKLSGYKTGEIAKMVGRTETNISTILHHPDAAALIEEVTQSMLQETIVTVKKEFVAHAHEAFRTTLLLMRTSRNDRIRLEAARDIHRASGVLESSHSNESPIDAASAKIIADAMKELVSDYAEFSPLGNSSDLDKIKAEVLEKEAIEELLNEQR